MYIVVCSLLHQIIQALNMVKVMWICTYVRLSIWRSKVTVSYNISTNFGGKACTTI